MMERVFGSLAASVFFYALTTGSVLAQVSQRYGGGHGHGHGHGFGRGGGRGRGGDAAASVPEIDAASGLLALAAVAALIALFYELRRRRAHLRVGQDRA